MSRYRVNVRWRDGTEEQFDVRSKDTRENLENRLRAVTFHGIFHCVAFLYVQDIINRRV